MLSTETVASIDTLTNDKWMEQTAKGKYVKE